MDPQLALDSAGNQSYSAGQHGERFAYPKSRRERQGDALGRQSATHRLADACATLSGRHTWKAQTVNHDEQPSQEIPKADGASEQSDATQIPLNLSPPGDSGDLSLNDVVGAVEFTYPNGGKSFILFTKRGLRMAPVNPGNRAILSKLAGSIVTWESWAKDAGDDGLARMLGDEAVDGSFKTAYMVKDADHREWLIVSVNGHAIACGFSDERYDQVQASEFHIQNKFKPPSGLAHTI